MAFELWPWAIGFGLEAVAHQLGRRAFSTTLNEEVERAAIGWAKRLPPEYFVDPQALVPVVEDADPGHRPGLAELRGVLRSKHVPTAEQWREALTEQWIRTRKNLGSDGQPFFRLEAAVARDHLTELARVLHQVCVENLTLFNSTVIAQLDALLARKQSPGVVLPDPFVVAGSSAIRSLALAVERETGWLVHLLLHDAGARALFVWGTEPPGHSSMRWALLAAACVVCEWPDIDRISIGPSNVEDMAHTNGTGVVGGLCVNFATTEVREIVRTKTIPLEFWNHVTASILSDPGTPFQKWKVIPFREVEDIRA